MVRFQGLGFTEFHSRPREAMAGFSSRRPARAAHLGCRVSGLGLGFRVSGLGLRVRVEGLGFRV